VPVVLLARRLAPLARGAWLAAGLLYAVNPYVARHGGDIMSEATYFALFVGALAAGAAGAERRSSSLLALAGGLAGAAYLARPEGAGAAAIVAGYTMLCGRMGRDLVRRAAGTLAVAAAFAVVAVPYMAEIGDGGLTFTKKKSLAVFVGVDEADTGAATRTGTGPPADGGTGAQGGADRAAAPAAPAGGLVRIPGLAWHVLDSFAAGYHPVPLALLVLGLALRRRRRERRIEALLLATLGAYLLVFMRVRAEWGYADKRHMLPLVTATLPIAGVGFVEAADRLAALLARRRPVLAARAPVLAIGGLAALVYGIQLPKTLATQRKDQLGELAAGRWIAQDAAARGIVHPPVFTHRDKVAYYGGGEWIQLPAGPAEASLARAIARGARYVAIREGRANDFWPGIERLLRRPPFALVHEERDGKGRFLVYFVARGP
jgi:4-amino-4-deoxy-L-arabinose transferase-like glycosyltransferase